MIKNIQHNKSQPQDQLIDEIISILRPGCFILLDGPLGSGKTTLIYELLKKFNFNLTSSPTYAVHQTYKTQQYTFEHLDLYRLETEDEIEASGFWDIIQNPDSIYLIEWSKRIDHDQLPLDRDQIFINLTYD